VWNCLHSSSLQQLILYKCYAQERGDESEGRSVEREVDKTREGMKTLVVDSEDGLGERGQQKASVGGMGGGSAVEVGVGSSGEGLEGTEGVREELRRIVGELVVTEGKEEGTGWTILRGGSGLWKLRVVEWK